MEVTLFSLPTPFSSWPLRARVAGEEAIEIVTSAGSDFTVGLSSLLQAKKILPHANKLSSFVFSFVFPLILLIDG
jgi:hypothetical protein